MDTLSRDQMALAVPANLKNSITQEMVDLVNNIVADPLVAEQVRENFISYTGVLKDGKYKTEDYIRAVTYVSFKLMGDTNQDAWCKTFPQRYQRLVQNGAAQKDISAHVSAYNKGKLVNAILEQSLVPTHVLNADLHQKAINHLAYLMENAQSEKVQSDSAIGLIAALKKPETKAELSITVEDNSGMNEMKQALTRMAETQRELIAGGAGIKTITASKIIEQSPQHAPD